MNKYQKKVSKLAKYILNSPLSCTFLKKYRNAKIYARLTIEKKYKECFDWMERFK
jgi:hypothetical protein